MDSTPWKVRPRGAGRKCLTPSGHLLYMSATFDGPQGESAPRTEDGQTIDLLSQHDSRSPGAPAPREHT